MSTIVVSRPPAASPVAKTSKVKGSLNSGPTHYGCEHLREIQHKVPAQAKAGYMSALKVVMEIRKVNSPKCVVCKNSVVRTRFCLQCPVVNCRKDGDTHRKSTGHVLDVAVDSRGGYLFCYACNDYVYDPTFEYIRLSNDIQVGLSASKKRKLDDMMKPSVEDHRSLEQNYTTASCKATGLRGLYNLGQTCYISVVIQSLVHNPLIRNFFLSQGHNPAECKRDYCMSCSLDEIFSEFFSGETKPYAMTNFLTQSWKNNSGKAMAGYGQHDAGEYLLFLLHELCESNGGDSSRLECKCITHQCFYGVQQGDRKCTVCLTEIEPVINTEMGIQLPLKRKSKDQDSARNAITLQECIDLYTNEDTVKANCSHCNKSDQLFQMQLTFKKLPNVLTISLKRFKQRPSGVFKKDESIVRAPMTLDMTAYTSQVKRKEGEAAGKAGKIYIYDLFSVIVHDGNLDNGHYICYSRCIDGQWYKLNDYSVSKATESEVLNVNPYILFYIIRTLSTS